MPLEAGTFEVLDSVNLAIASRRGLVTLLELLGNREAEVGEATVLLPVGAKAEAEPVSGLLVVVAIFVRFDAVDTDEWVFGLVALGTDRAESLQQYLILGPKILRVVFEDRSL